MNDEKLYNIKEGFEKGNIFKYLYEPYKNYKIATFVPKDDYENTILKLDELSFYLHDLKLYLCNNPKDTKVISIYNDYMKEFNDVKNYYENKYKRLSNDILGGFY